MIILVALTCGVILYINDFMIQKVIQDNLIEIVENDVDEIEYFLLFKTKKMIMIWMCICLLETVA